jgi:hypothetical protein
MKHTTELHDYWYIRLHGGKMKMAWLALLEENIWTLRSGAMESLISTIF